MNNDGIQRGSASCNRARRYDEWCCSYFGPSSTPGVSKLHVGVFRGMRDEQQAVEYAQQVAEFFGSVGSANSVYVVRGPTSTTRMPFEVVDACAGYTVLHRIEPMCPEVVAEHDSAGVASDRPRA
jgi:hypothetical protein